VCLGVRQRDAAGREQERAAAAATLTPEQIEDAETLKQRNWDDWKVCLFVLFVCCCEWWTDLM
jgi:hypothetical protein